MINLTLKFSVSGKSLDDVMEKANLEVNRLTGADYDFSSGQSQYDLVIEVTDDTINTYTGAFSIRLRQNPLK